MFMSTVLGSNKNMANPKMLVSGLNSTSLENLRIEFYVLEIGDMLSLKARISQVSLKDYESHCLQ